MKLKKYTWFLIWILFIYLLVGAVLYFTQSLFLFHGKKLNKQEPFQIVDQQFKEINIIKPNGFNLSCVTFFPTDTLKPSGVCIYYHGNRENINRYALFAKRFTAAGYIVYMPDYPGFGKSTGPNTELIMKQDGQTIYNLAKKQYPNLPILIYGKSMGTGVASFIAAHNKIDWLLLETPYYSLPTIYDDFTWIYPTKFLLKHHFETFKELPKVTAPITIFHGTHDALIKLSNASMLKKYLKPNDEFVTIEKAKHNNIPDFQIYTDKVDSVLSIIDSIVK
jgi:uncharacterized protein